MTHLAGGGDTDVDAASAPGADAKAGPARPSPGPARRRPWTTLLWLGLALLVLARIVSLVAVLNSGQERDQSVLGGDARRYAQIVGAEGTPYADFAVEYPPEVYALLKVIVVQDDHMATLIRLGISQLLFDLAVAALVGWGWGRRAGFAYLLLGLPFLLFPFIYLRVDLLSVLIATAGLALFRRRHDLSGGALIAAAVFAKLWPIALAPVFILERRWRALVAWAVTGAVGLAAWMAWAGPRGVIDVLSFRGARGWQVESLPGILLHLADPSRANVEQGAWRTGIMPGWSRPTLTLLSFGFLALGWWWAHRRRVEGAPDSAIFALAPLAGILSLLIFAPIISPQYLLWLLPFAAILAAEREWPLTVMMLVVSGLSVLEFSQIHGQIDGYWWATWPIVARNIALVVMFIVALLELAAVLPSPTTTPAQSIREER